MKKALVVLAVVIGLALVFTSGYAQKWDSAMEAQAIAKGKPFKFTAIEVVSVDPKGQTAVLKGPKGKTAVARFGYAKYEGSYSGVADIKPGEKISGEGQVVNGTNWIQRVAPAATGAAPAVGPNKD